MQQTGILILTSPLRYLVDNIGGHLITSSKYVSKRLYIKLEPTQEKLHPPMKKSVSDLTSLYKFIPTLYSKASLVCETLDVRLLLTTFKNPAYVENHLNTSIDIALTDSTDTTANIKQYINTQFQKPCLCVIQLDKSFESNCNFSGGENTKLYDIVTLGGTFDRLHNGHKILLSTAVARATKKLIIGVVDGVMLKRKQLWELIEPLQERINIVNDFVRDIDPTITYSIVPIYDPFGPAIIDPDMDCIVVSEETKTGGLRINEERLRKNLKELDVIVVNLLQDPSYIEGYDVKISSSNHRRNVLGTFLKQIKAKPILLQPLSIALIGGPMNGKSTVFNCIKTLGVRAIDTYDIIIELLSSHSSINQELKRQGLQIMDTTGEISLKSLSFSALIDQNKKKKIHSILLPEVIRLVKSKIEQSSKNMQDGFIVLVKIAEFLLDEWIDDFTCIWTSIMPEQQRIENLSNFYGISNAEASQIINSYPSNIEFVKKAHIVLSPQWNEEDTRKQVQTAFESVKHWKLDTKSTL